jgi:hypothetical protein
MRWEGICRARCSSIKVAGVEAGEIGLVQGAWELKKCAYFVGLVGRATLLACQGRSYTPRMCLDTA